MEIEKVLKTILITVGVFLVVTFPWSIMAIVNFFTPGPPAPMTTYGEFPFRIVYEIGDERYVIDDTLICEYAGRNKEGYTGKELKWAGRLLSGEKISQGYLNYEEPVQGNEWKYGFKVMIIDHVATGYGYIGQLKIDIGSAQYYLGYYALEDYAPGRAYDGGKGFLDAETLLEKYDVRIIETAFSAPMSGNGIEVMKE